MNKLAELDDKSLEITKENQQLLKNNKEKKDNNGLTTKNKILIGVGIAAVALTAGYFGIGYLIYTDCVENHDRVF
jgi:ABC-type antimicrobial peptide transport system permease subunit